MIVIRHLDGEDGAYGMCVDDLGIHSIWQCARPECRPSGSGDGFMVIERCHHRWWRILVGAFKTFITGKWHEPKDCRDEHSDRVMNLLEAHWTLMHPGVEWRSERPPLH